MGTESTWALPVLPARFPCEAKIALRNKDDLKGKKKKTTTHKQFGSGRQPNYKQTIIQ